MALPVFPKNALDWQRYNSTDTLIAQYGLDFSTYSAFTFNPTGTVQGAPNAQSTSSASGVSIDNTNNKNAVSLTIGSKYTETIPPYVKSTISLGGTPPSIVISAPGGQSTATFYRGDYPGTEAHTNVLGATLQAIAVYLPPGLMINFCGNVGSIPSGWLYCNGQAVSRITYAALFAVIGTTFGGGDGASTFNLPDFRGRFLRGFDDGANIDPNRVYGSVQGDSEANHYHRTAVGWNNAAMQLATDGGGPHYGNDNLVLSQNTIQFTSSGAGNNYFARTDTTAYYANDGTETRPKNIAVLYIIKT